LQKKEITCNQVPVGTNDGCTVGFGVGVWDGSDVGLQWELELVLQRVLKKVFLQFFPTKIVRIKDSIFNCTSFGFE